jgi:hypothetical protein
MAKLTPQKVSLDGLNPTFAAADVAGDRFTNYGKTIFHVKNGDTVSKTVTINASKLCSHGYMHDETVSIPANDGIQIGPFKKDRFNTENSEVEVSYDDVTSVTVAAIQL